MIPNILSIAGSDPSAGAGIQADLKAIAATGGYGLTAITALTVQNTRGVQDVLPVKAGFVADQIAALRADIRIDAVKLGMLGTATVVRAVARAITGLAPLVVDPVMIASSGRALLQPDAVSALRDLILPHCEVLTPNLPEAAALLSTPEATTRSQMMDQARAILALGPRAVLLKGGHLPGGISPDLLLSADTATWLEAPRLTSRATHGTGCTLASALATRLAAGDDLVQAATRAKGFTRAAIRGGAALSVGTTLNGGHGPGDALHALRPIANDTL